MKKIKVNLKNKAYQIIIGRNILASIGREIESLGVGKKILVVSNKKIPKIFLKTVQKWGVTLAEAA